MHDTLSSSNLCRKKSLELNFKTDVLHKTKEQDGDSKLSQLLNLCSEALKISEGLVDLLFRIFKQPISRKVSPSILIGEAILEGLFPHVLNILNEGVSGTKIHS